MENRATEAWFEQPERAAALDVPEELVWESEDKPDNPDFAEASAWVQKNARPFLVFLAIVLASWHIIRLTIEQFAGGTTWEFHVSVLSGVVGLSVTSFSFALAAPLRRYLLDGPIPITKMVIGAVRVWPRVFVTTAISMFAFTVGFIMCVLPGLLLLDRIVRAPYEAALGATPILAFKRSFAARRQCSTLGASAAFSIINAGIAIILLSILSERLEAFVPWPAIAPFVLEMIVVAITLGLWVEVFSVHLVGDAIFGRVLTRERLHDVRTANDLNKLTRFMRSVFRVSGPIFGMLFIAFAFQKTSVPPIEPGTDAAEFSLETMEGETRTLADFQQKPLVIYAWAPWCGPCKLQVPQINALHEDRADAFEVVAVSLDYQNKREVVEYIEDRGVEYPVLLGTRDFMHSYGINAFPTVLVIDTNRKITHSWSGVTSTKTIRDAILR